MRHVPKQDFMGCAIAAAAMLTGRSYSEVAAHPRGSDPADARIPDRFRRLMEALTYRAWQVTALAPEPAVAALDVPEWPVPVFIHNPLFAHWIVVDGQTVHDPGDWSAVPMRRYARRQWRASHVLEPADSLHFHMRPVREYRATMLRQLLSALERHPSTL
jgi:hypothetical protein